MFGKISFGRIYMNRSVIMMIKNLICYIGGHQCIAFLIEINELWKNSGWFN